MMSAHEVAVAALNEVASVSRPEDGALPLSATTPFATAASIDAAADAAAHKSSNAIVTSSQISNPAGESGSSHNSQSTVPDNETPPSSNFSSHSHDQGFQAQDVARSVPDTHEAGAPLLTVATNAGQKRTIDGYVRRSSGSSSSDSAAMDYNGGHSRNTSAISAASSAMSPRELTSELRTLLSYAMVKVNKGWESLPIYEVESLASQCASPASSTSTINGRRNLISSPRAAIASRQGLSAASSQPSTLTASAERRESISFTDNQPSSRTYESFWRSQNQRQTGLSSPSSSQLSLQPSADLSSAPRNPPQYARSPTKPPQQRTLLQTTASDLSQSSLTSTIVAPSTPGQGARTPRADALQTPTQKSLQEQDAIATLLFMSSPGNPLMGAFPGAQQGSRVQSPLKTERETTPRAYETGTARYRARRRIGGGEGQRRLLGEDEIERMLDARPEEESSDDEIELPTTPMRAAMGRA